MSLFVQKFGGTSLATLEHIEKAADRIIQTLQDGHQVIVVVSAMGHETDRLITLAHGLSHQPNLSPNPREYAALIASGEQVSAALLSLCLEKRGWKARSFTGAQAGIVTDDQFEKARILSIEDKAIRQALTDHVIPVIAGFQGINESGDITTLGRGGSDTTAVALAAHFSADECQIFTDVNGVYTMDPRIEPRARLLDTITTGEMLELSSLGNKVLQVRSVEIADKYHVPLRVLSSSSTGNGDGVNTSGTYISHDKKSQKEPLEMPIISGITYHRQEAKITLSYPAHHIHIIPSILGELSHHAIEIDMMTQYSNTPDQTTLTFTVNRDDYFQTMALLDKSAIFQITGDNTVGKLSVVGVGIRNHTQVIKKIFHTLAQENIAIQLISLSEIKISVMIAEEHIETGTRILHSAFRLDEVPQEAL